MITKQINGIPVICADEGKWLVKGESYSNTDIYLGIHDKPENWIEVDTEPVPPEAQDPEQAAVELPLIQAELAALQQTIVDSHPIAEEIVSELEGLL